MSFVDPEELERKEKEAQNAPKPSQADEEYPLIKVLERIAIALEKLANKPYGVANTYTSNKVSTPAPAPVAKETEPTEESDDDIIKETANKFPDELAAMLNFSIEGDYVRIAPKRFLGSDNFAKIATVVRNICGEYKSAGRDSHFLVPI